MNTRKALCLTASAAIAAAVLPYPFRFASAEKAKSEDIVILYTNDVHAYADQGVGYDGLKLYQREMEAQYENVFTVDAGDAIQGAALGSLTQGADVTELMNEIGYDVCTPGNHEFDYSLETLLERAEELDCGYTCCNFKDLETGETVFEPYQILEAGDKKIAFVGVTTPETFSKARPSYFMNENGEYIYSFAEEGDSLYDIVQESVDAARKEDADYVILLGHLGENDVVSEWSAMEVAAHTTGIDAIIDAHSHEVTPGMTVKAQDGKSVTITQTGTRLSHIGRLVIGEDGTITTELLDSIPEPDESLGLEPDSYQENENKPGSFADTEMHQKMQEIYDKLADMNSEKIGSTASVLYNSDPETGERRVRNAETNLGDLCADALREVLGTDAAFLIGSYIRSDIPEGDITLQNLMDVQPYGNKVCSAEVTGQQILDLLELGAQDYPEESAVFLQVSGIAYAIDPDVESSVVLDEKGMLEGITGERRVHSVMIGGIPLDPEAVYTVGSIDYLLKNGGDRGILSGKCELISDEEMLDTELLAEYIRQFPDGEIPEYYQDPEGHGRIRITAEPVDWMQNPESLMTPEMMQETPESGASTLPAGVAPGMLPEGMDMSMLPEGFDPSMLPEGMDLATLMSMLPEDFDWSSIDENFDWTQLMQPDEETMREMLIASLLENMDPAMAANFDPDSIDWSKLPEDFDWTNIPEDFDWSILFGGMGEEDAGQWTGQMPEANPRVRVPFILTPRPLLEPTPMKEIPANSYPAYITSVSDTLVTASAAKTNTTVTKSPYTADKRPVGLLATLSALALSALPFLRKRR